MKRHPKLHRPTRLEEAERLVSLALLAVAALPLILILLLAGVGVRLMGAVEAVLRAAEKVGVVDRLMGAAVGTEAAKERAETEAAREAAVTEMADRLKAAAMETDRRTTATLAETEAKDKAASLD